MDGGGRLLRPLTAGPAGGAAVLASPLPDFSPSSLPIFRFLARARLFRSRRQVAPPAGSRIPRFLGTGLTFAFLGTVAAVGLSAGGELQGLREQYGEPHHLLARALGLGVERVSIAGLGRLNEGEVLAGAGITSHVSLPFVGVAAVRERLEQMPLVKSASVRKLYPNELVISLVEREPHALWQKNGELFIIAADGTVMDEFRDARFADLPLVVGEEANIHTKDYLALLDSAGPLKERIRAGTLVSGRRWTLKTDNGIDVRLPEQAVGDAIARLIRLEREQKILEKDVIAIDLRMPDRVVVRLTEEAAAARLEGLKKKPMRGKGVET
jgi:cell division protein FtsQ